MRVRFRTNEQLRTRPRSSARVSSPSRSDPSQSISASSMLDLRPMGAASSRLRLACGGCGRSWPRGGNTPRTVGHDAHQTRGRHAGLDSQVPPTASPRSNRLPIYPSLPPRGGAVLIPAWCLSQPLLGQGDGADDAGPPGGGQDHPRQCHCGAMQLNEGHYLGGVVGRQSRMWFLPLLAAI